MTDSSTISRGASSSPTGSGSGSGRAAVSDAVSDYQIFSDALHSFASTQSSLNIALQQSQHSLDHQFSAHDSNLSQCSKQWAEYGRLTRLFHEIKGRLSANEQRALKAQLDSDFLSMSHAKSLLDDWQMTKPSTSQSLFLSLVLGKQSLFMHRKSDRLEFKDNYNLFKKQTTVIFVIFPLLQLLLIPNNKTLFQLHQLWLLYYYFTLSLRENILYLNGSSMKKWWIYHHYVSIAISLILLLWPDEIIMGDNQRRYQRLMFFGLIQGAVMLAQNAYQAKRAYVRKTLGKSRAIDVDATETIIEKPTDLHWLVPMLYGLYAYELYLGCELLWEYFAKGNYVKSWHCAWIGIFCIVLSVGNAVTTSQVLIGKQRFRQFTKVLRASDTAQKDGKQQ